MIPARFGSTRFPGKPLHPIAGKPLLQHVWERCKSAKGIAEVVVATDDRRIEETATSFGARVALTSPHHQSGTDRCAEVAARMDGITHVINVQGDEPLIDPDLVSELARTLTSEESVQMITAANVFPDGEDVTNPNSVKVVLDRHGNALYFSRSPIPFIRDTQTTPFYRHQGIYGYSIRFLLDFVSWDQGLLERSEQLEQLRALENGAKIRVVITKHASIGVDSPSDVAAVEPLLLVPHSR
ncbi:MAG: 3-deoxy-manno-octulosonate cytidylyltransferase [Verrucomicrobiaceae bacterium]|nr:MAG: 3-deoxy-manno-octulosonate cytidylyltransferase [Verrucomicrobiaceae bacterium]